MFHRGYPRNRHPRGRGNNRNPPAAPGRNARPESQFGSNPGASHGHRFSRFGLRSPSEIERWLENQVTIPTTHLIPHLSSPEGLHILRQIADNRSLSSEIVIKLARLVTQDGIRSSVERYDTNKIYGVFPGSAFLSQIQGFIGDMIEAKPKDIWPFVHLFEEMQNRTSDGWRYLQSEALREAIDGIPESAEKNDLSQQLSKLVEYRNKMKRQQQLSKSEGQYQGSNVGSLPIIPTEDEISSSRSEQLPINRIDQAYNSVDEYLSTHFHLVREDCFASLRSAIQGFRKNVVPDNIRRYKEVKFMWIQCGDQGLEHCIRFKTTKQNPVDWGSSKQMMSGALLCISSDGFQNYAWGIVKERDNKSLEKGIVVLQLIPSNEGKFDSLEKHKSYEMIESTAAYFEAYAHVLKCLQRPEMKELPFSEHLLSLEPQVMEPGYLKKRQMKDAYNLECAFPDIQNCLGRSTVNILQEWPKWNSSLDESQMEAVKLGLTKRLAIIQGPPGTGKTYVGLTIARILLSNIQCGPILVICYTNHALDQFLESIYSVENNIVRLGGRSTNEIMLKRSLKELKRGASISGPLRSRHGELMQTKMHLEEQIRSCVFRLRARRISSRMLSGIASQRQIESLYSKYSINDQTIEEVWLEGMEDELVADKDGWKRKGKQKMLSNMPVTTYNTFSSLDKADDHGEPNGIPTTADDYGEPNVIRTAGDDHGESNGIPADDDHGEPNGIPAADEGVPANPANNSSSADISLDEILGSEDVWLLPKKSRIRLHNYWLQKAIENAEEELHHLSEIYKEVCDGLLQLDRKLCLQILREAKVVGMTTTGAAKNYDVLQALGAEIVVIEEAAEVLEAHVLPCIGPFTQHLILLGDHIQLRPSVAEYELATKYKLEISLFERLISGGIDHVTLRCQRRMKPSISSLISDLYPSLQDHFSVIKYENIKGMRNDVFFLDHKAMESQTSDANSKINVSEARLVVELCVYLLRQGYNNSDITILTMYKGQMSEIQRDLNDRLRYRNRQTENDKVDDPAPATPRVCSVDNYQGEECNIIILSLVRSNKKLGIGGSKGNIGFLKVANRVCVALSRAKTGLYILGNAELLRSKSTLWESIIQKLKSSNSIGPALTLACQNHPQTETKVSVTEDFRQVEDGGCSRPCEYQLKCGHACTRRCHPSDHDSIVCPKPCPHKFEATCGHQCTKICHFPTYCPPCQVLVSKILPGCGHRITLPCSTAAEEAICNEPCPALLDCGHPCKLKCGRPCGPCKVNVFKILHCGHRARLPCFEDPDKFPCDRPCGQVLRPGCEHICKGTCGSCKQGTSHIPCKERCSRDLPCGHQCMAGCSEICPPCKYPCEKRCLHSRCVLICGSLCRPCMEKCEWKCEHHTCDLLCHETCSRPRCEELCREILRCGHPCIGLCGEPCPRVCRICHPEYLDVITQMTLEENDPYDRFVELVDCGHVFEVSGLDTWMDMDDAVAEPRAAAIKLKQCPGCRSPIRRTLRYSNIVKMKLQQIEEVKKLVIGFEKLKRGNDMLVVKNYEEAMVEFRAALSSNPGLLEAHLSQARAFCGLHDYDQAIQHLSLIIERSSYKVLILEKLPILSLKSSLSTNIVNSKLADNELAIDALLQWALVYSARNDFTTGLAICNIILQRNPNHAKTVEIREELMTGNRVRREVIEVITKEVGGRGHWYQCPNGHVYVVGECGGPMQTSQCPDCKATVGGESHRPAEGNSHADIDGSSHPAWSNATGLGAR